MTAISFPHLLATLACSTRKHILADILNFYIYRILAYILISVKPSFLNQT